MKYVIYNIENVDTIDFAQIFEDGVDTLRLSVNGEKTVLKFEGETPDFLVGLSQYNHSEMLEIMKTDEWNQEQEI
tara:strand:- start:182 stop:406 length:225 start_codon:yes stop_codon:yes gene_type:complete